MSFQKFKELHNEYLNINFAKDVVLVQMDIDKDKLYSIFLDSFPSGTNEIYRERREHDCNCCKHYIRSLGGVCFITKDLKIKSIWEFKSESDTYQPVVDAMSKYVKSCGIQNIFLSDYAVFGSVDTVDNIEDKLWSHFHYQLPQRYVSKQDGTIGAALGVCQTNYQTLKRSFQEISITAIEDVKWLINDNNLLRGTQHAAVINGLYEAKKKYERLSSKKQELFIWQTVHNEPYICYVRNSSIGTLLVDLSSGEDLSSAVNAYESKVDPNNYKRPKPLFTKQMLAEGKKALESAGFMDSLARTHAVMSDISVNDIIFADRTLTRKLKGSSSEDVFGELEKSVVQKKPKKLNITEELYIDEFINSVVPNADSIHILFDAKLKRNLISVIKQANKDSKPMSQWNNVFTWVYKGNLADSAIKQNVKAVGANTDAILRFSLQWNDREYNGDDYDAHCIEPSGNLISFPVKGKKQKSSGLLDHDIVDPKKGTPAIENITWTDVKKMQKGTYQFRVHNFTHRGGDDGFIAEIEYNGEIYTYEYRHKLKGDECVNVATIDIDASTGKFDIIKSLDSRVSASTEWNLTTGNFQPVSLLMNSPNYWKTEKGVGNKHYFFIVPDCLNDETPNGFFNEYITGELTAHKRVLAALGDKMTVDYSDNQLSGLGFTEGRNQEVICKVQIGNKTKMVKVLF